MLINVNNRQTQFRTQNILTRMMVAIERRYKPKFENIISKQYKEAAKKVSSGELYLVSSVLNAYLQEIIFFLMELYRRSANIFLDFVREDIEGNKGVYPTEKKELQDIFWNIMNGFIASQSLRKATQLNTFTKVLVGRTIKKGIDDGLTNQEISKNIVSKGLIDKKWRADRVVRTETHTASIYSVDTAIKATGVVKEKQWVHAGDARVRVKRFNHIISEIAHINEPYIQTGEALDFPGDWHGSGGNVINCRCCSVYFTSDSSPGIF